MTEFTQIALGIIFLTVFCGLFSLIKLRNKLNIQHRYYSRVRDENRKLFFQLTDYNESKKRQAIIYERAERNRRVIVVHRQCRHGIVVIKEIPYDPNDKDDRDYKYIYAHELVDKLNEEP